MLTNPASPPPPRHAQRHGRGLTRRASLAATLLLAGALMLAWGGLLGTAVQTSANAAPPAAVNQCNGTDEGGGRAVQCTVVIINNLDMATGLSSSSITVTECHGFANAPLTLVCTGPTTTVNATQLTTAVTQCDGSALGGGATVDCHVDVTNNITGIASTSPATVDECVGSGTGGGIEPTTLCDPVQSTTNATITQCNGSANGGGGTMRVRCTVTPSTETAALPISIDQCNDSAADGSTVTCTSSVVNLITAPVVSSTATSTATSTVSSTATSTVSSTASPTLTGSTLVSAPVSSPPVISAPVSSPPVSSPPVSSPPVSSPPVSSPPFVPPPGLTGDSRPSNGTGRSDSLLGAGAVALAGGLVLLVPRRRRR